MSTKKPYRILGIDLGVISMKHLDSQQLKLKQIFERITLLIDLHDPTEMAIEAPFFGKNVQSMLKLGRAQGVAIAAAMTKEVSITEYSPKKIKQSVCGNGNASKEQVAAMLYQLFKVRLDDYMLDATDALATAVCHYFQAGLPQSETRSRSKHKDWKSFLRENPNRHS